MKKQSFLALAIVTLISITNVIGAAGFNRIISIETMNFQIPFDFNVGDKQFSAGKYKIQTDPTASLLILTNGDDSPQTIIGAISIGKQKKNKAIKLVFYRYGDRHFLRKVEAPTHSSNLKNTKPEKTAKKESGSKSVKVEVNP